MSSVSIFGAAGYVGATVARALAVFPDVTRITLCDLNLEALEGVATDLETIAERQRLESLVVKRERVDMRDEDAIVDFLNREMPDGLIQAAIPYSWYRLSGTLPPELWHRLHLEGKLGPWLPLLLVLPLKLMRARARANSTAPVVQVSYPDGVNPVLNKVGLCPSTGAGNTESVATIMRIVAAERLGVPIRDVTVRLVAHHFHSGSLWSQATPEELSEFFREYPLWYRIGSAGEDVTQRLAGEDLLVEIQRRFPHGPRPLYAATSAAKNMLRLLRDDHSITHVSSPAGLPGGFDARLSRSGAKPVWHTDLPEAAALNLVRHAGRGDGIQEIAEDGTVTFTESSSQALKKYLGYDCRVLPVDEVEQRAEELVGCIHAVVGSTA